MLTHVRFMKMEGYMHEFDTVCKALRHLLSQVLFTLRFAVNHYSSGFYNPKGTWSKNTSAAQWKHLFLKLGAKINSLTSHPVE